MSSGMTRMLVRAPLVLSLIVGSQAAQGQGVLKKDPSIRGSGMGRASTAVFWGADPCHWRNPALVGYGRSVCYEYGRTQLVPDLADDVYLTTHRLALSGWGLGLALEGKPFDALGGYLLHYGETEIVDTEGYSYGFSESWEETDAWGASVSLLHLLDSGLDLADVDAGQFHRFGDVSLGMRRNSVEISLEPERAMEIIGVTKDGEGSTTTTDWGYLVRLTPYNSIDFDGSIPALDGLLDPVFGGICIEGAYAGASQNYRDDTIAYSDGDPHAVPRLSRRGWSVHAAIGFPGHLREGLEDAGLGWLVRSLTPLLSWGKSWNRSVRSLKNPSSGVDYEDPEAESSGWEVTFGNIFTLRRGLINNPHEEIHGTTSGWGLGFQVSDLGGFRYDHATVPRALDLADEEREGVVVFVEPLAIMRTLRAR